MAYPTAILLATPPVRHRHPKRHRPYLPFPWFLRTKLNFSFSGGGGILLGGGYGVTAHIIFSGGGGIKFGGGYGVTAHVVTGQWKRDTVTTIADSINPDSQESNIDLEQETD